MLVNFSKSEEAFLQKQDKNFLRDMVQAHMAPKPVIAQTPADPRGVGISVTPANRARMDAFYAEYLAEKWMGKKSWAG